MIISPNKFKLFINKDDLNERLNETLMTDRFIRLIAFIVHFYDSTSRDLLKSLS